METAHSRQSRILVVDDEQALTRMLKLNLEGSGLYVVQEENRGAHALAAAREFKPDLILLDIILPDISGGDIAAQLKADASLARTPIIFLTGIMSTEHAQRASAPGGDHYVAKPATVDELLDSIHGKLDSSQLAPYACLAKPFTFEELLHCMGACLQRRSESKER